MRLVHRIAGIEGVAPNATPRLKMQVGRRYHGLKFFVTQAGAPVDPSTMISRVRQYVNGSTIRDVSTARLIKLATLNGITPALGELPIAYSEPWRADKVDEQITAWDLFGESTFEIEFVMTAAANPGITGIQIFDTGQTLIDGKPVKNIITQKEVGKNSLAGLNDFDNLPIRDPIHRILLDSPQVINSIEVTADRNKVQELIKAENARVLADYGLVSTAFEFPICFDFTEQIIGDALIVARDLNVRFDLAAAAQVTALVEARASGF